MPYNNTPITPGLEVTGTSALPLARVKKIIKADPDTGDCSNNAAFAISIAAEMFVQHLVERAQAVVMAEHAKGKGGRGRTVQYKHVAGAVTKFDNLEFLSDVVPNTVQFREYQKQRRARTSETVLNGQQKIAWNNPTGVEEHEAKTEEGGSEFVGSHRPRSSQESAGPGGQARHNFDAVRNAYETGPGRDVVPMEED